MAQIYGNARRSPIRRHRRDDDLLRPDPAALLVAALTSARLHLSPELETYQAEVRRLIHHANDRLDALGLRAKIGFDQRDQPSFATLGIDALTAIQFIGALEAKLGRVIPSSTLWDHKTLNTLAEHLVDGDANA